MNICNNHNALLSKFVGEKGEIDMYYYDANSSSVVMVKHPIMSG